jgi:hypothetical protein
LFSPPYWSSSKLELMRNWESTLRVKDLGFSFFTQKAEI